MNKAILYGVAAIVGVGAAVAVFNVGGGEGGSESTAQTEGAPPKEPTKMVHDPESKRREPRPVGDAAPVPGSAKDTEFMRKRAALRGSALAQHANAAAPSWQGAAMELSAAPELAAKCRALSTELRMAAKNPEASAADLIEKEEALLAEVKAQGGVREETLSHLEELISNLESAPVTPVDAGTTPAMP